jgi:hypothetical protein
MGKNDGFVRKIGRQITAIILVTAMSVLGVLDGSSLNVQAAEKGQSASANKSVILSLSNNQSGVVAGSFTEVKGAVKYVVQYATDKNFTSAMSITKTKTTFTVKNLNKQTYYFRVQTFWKDKAGRTLSVYGKSMSIKVKNAITEYPASTDCVKLTYCKATSPSQVTVKATVNKRVRSDDNNYYCVTQDPFSGAITNLGKTAKGNAKNESLSFIIDISGKNKNNLEQKYAIAVLTKGSYQFVSKTTYVTNTSQAAVNTNPIVTPTTKKGIQGYEYALFGGADLNPKHVFFNVDLASLISKKGADKTIAYKYGGKTYYFSNAELPELGSLCKKDLQITMQVVLTWKDELSYLTYGAKTNMSSYYALNTSNEKAYRTLEAAFSFLGEYYNGNDVQGYVTNWILGNEVNSRSQENYAPPSLSNADYVRDYATAFRLLTFGVKRGFANSRVYICTEHSWGYEQDDWGGEPLFIYSAKDFMTDFNAALKSQSSGMKWNLAFHPYAFPLTVTDFWNRTTVNDSNGVDHITMKNLEVMTDFVKNTFGTNTRILLSEVGYSSTNGEDQQAAAIAYTYYKAQFNPMVDAVMFRSYEDNATELSMGLAMGLATDHAATKKKAYNVFKYMDTKSSTKYTKPYLGTIGISNWSSVIPGYSDSLFSQF